MRDATWPEVDAREKRAALSLAVVLTIAASAIPSWVVVTEAWRADWLGLQSVPWPVVRSFVLLALGLLLVLPTRERSGLRIGRLREHWRGVLLVCGATVLATALVYPLLPVRPFGRAHASMWAVSPLAQELVFSGFIYGYLESRFPEYLHPRVRIRWALLITTILFGLWHAPSFLTTSAGYVWFQIFYTGVLGIVPALSRQWTGSILPTVLCHTAVNFIAWSAG